MNEKLNHNSWPERSKLADKGAIMGNILYTHDEDFFSRDTRESFYWAGFIAADGCITEDSRRVKKKTLAIKLARKDESHLREFKKAIKYTGKIFRHYELSQKDGRKLYRSQLRITISKSNVAYALARFNIIPRKSLIYTFPEWLKKHPLVGHFIRGYFDGDGCASIDKKSKTGTELLALSFCGTEKFLNICQEVIMENCDIKTERTIKKHSGVFVLRFHGTQMSLSVGRFIYTNSDNLRLERKFKIYTKFEYRRDFVREKSVIGIDVNTGKILKFDSILDAAKGIGKCSSGISHCLSGRVTTCGGYFWKYDTERKAKVKYK